MDHVGLQIYKRRIEACMKESSANGGVFLNDREFLLATR